MKGIFTSEYVSRIFAERTKRRRVIYIMLILSVLAAVYVFWTLHRVGIAMTDEFLCGMTEHTHSAECGDSCGLEEHIHTAECTSDISADFETEEVWQASLPQTLTNDIRQNMTAIALSQTGYRESERNFTLSDSGERKGFTRYGQWYGNPYGDWNTMFVYFCMYYSGISREEIPYGSGCMAWFETLSQNGLVLPPDYENAAPGDVFFLDTDYDGIADRTAVATEFFDAENGPALYAVEGDTEDETAQTSYYRGDERIIGWLSLGETYSAEEISAELPYGVQYLASSSFDYMKINGIPNYSTEENRIKVNSGKPITIEVTLDKFTQDGEYNKFAYFKEINEDEYAALRAGNKDGIASWQCFRNGNRFFYSKANFWLKAYTVEEIDNVETSVDLGYEIPIIPRFTFDTKTETALYTATVYPKAIPYGGEPYYIDMKYLPCDGSGYDESHHNPFLTVVPPEINILTDNEGANNHQTQDKAYETEPGKNLEIQATVKLSECSREVSADYTPTDDEKSNGMEVVELSDGKTYGIYARFINYGFAEPIDRHDTRVVPHTVYELLPDDNLRITYTIKVNAEIKNYRYNVIEFYPGEGQGNVEHLWVDIKPAESTSTLSMVKTPDGSSCDVSYTVHTLDNPLPMDGRKSVTLEGTTKWFTEISSDEYDNLSDAEKREYMMVADKDNQNNFRYLKTNAAFWAYDTERDENNHLKNTALKRESIVYEVKDNLLHIKITYMANETDDDVTAAVTFFDGTPISREQEWRYYKGFHIKVNRFVYIYTPVYVRTENGWKEKNRINEYVDGLPIAQTDGFIPNSEERPYILYPGDELFLYVDKQEGYIMCDQSNNKEIDGQKFHVLETITSYGDSTIVPGKTVLVKGYKAADFLPYNTVDSPKQSVWVKEEQDGEEVGMMKDLYDGSYIVKINYRLPDYTFDEDSSFYVKVMPSEKTIGECVDDYLDHCDIEIAEGGIYEFIRTLLMPDGSRQEIHEYYDSMITGVESCDIYSDADGTEPVKRYKGYNKNTGELEYDDSEVRFIKTDYMNNGAAGSTQFEFTSKYKDSDKKEFNDVHFRPDDVKNVTFMVQLTLIPHQKMVMRYDSSDTLVSAEPEAFSGTSIIMENIKIQMTGQSIVDALNKCPNHSGLDFTFVKPIRNLTTIKAGSAVITAKKTLLKVSPDDHFTNKGSYPLRPGQFTFKITDTKNDEDPGNDDVFYAVNDWDGNIVFPEFTYAAEGTYRYIISEVIPEKKNNILYDEGSFIVNVTVTYNDGEPDNNDDRRFETTVDYGHVIVPEFVNRYATYELPMTGGEGTVVFYAASGIIMTAVIAIFIYRRRKEK